MLFGKKCCMPNMEECRQQPIMEPVITNCIEKEFYHEVPHCCPIHTHVVNKHIYNHTYAPQYTCDEENVIINVDSGGCSKYMNNNF